MNYSTHTQCVQGKARKPIWRVYNEQIRVVEVRDDVRKLMDKREGSDVQKAELCRPLKKLWLLFFADF